MRISLEIETNDRLLGFDIAGVDSTLKAGNSVQVPGGATVTYEGSTMAKAVGIPEVLQFVVEASVAVELNLLAAWLYDKVKQKPVDQLVINRRVVTEITPERIRQVFEEELRRS